MYKAVCFSQGEIIDSLTGTDIIDAANKVDQWLASHPNQAVTWHITEDKPEEA